jgi:hypothetical protein
MVNAYPGFAPGIFLFFKVHPDMPACAEEGIG